MLRSVRALAAARVPLLVVALFVLAAGHSVRATPVDCDQLPDPARWQAAGTPDAGAARMTIATHRGAADLAPENTLDAYRYAIAYGSEMIEVDVQMTSDHRFVSFHDMSVDAKTGGTGQFPLLTYDEARTLNVADNDKWKGSEYDPSQMPSLEEVLELARDTGTGVYFDIKESVLDPVGVADMAASYGVMANSSFLTYEPFRAAAIRAAYPNADLMLSNPDPRFPPALLYAIGQDYKWFGSSLPNYSPESIAAVHDACGLVIPNVYQGDVTGTEAGDLAYARSIGADGAQVNHPDIAADVLDEPVATTLAVDEGAGTVCLVDATHGFGLPEKDLDVDGGTLATRRGGCATLPAGYAGTIAFGGDGSALASSISLGPVTSATQLVYVGDTSYRGKTVRLAASLTDADGAPVADRTVTFELEGVTYSATTNADGIAETTAPIKSKTATVSVAFAGDGSFEPSSTTATITRAKNS